MVIPLEIKAYGEERGFLGNYIKCVQEIIKNNEEWRRYECGMGRCPEKTSDYYLDKIEDEEKIFTFEFEILLNFAYREKLNNREKLFETFSEKSKELIKAYIDLNFEKYYGIYEYSIEEEVYSYVLIDLLEFILYECNNQISHKVFWYHKNSLILNQDISSSPYRFHRWFQMPQNFELLNGDYSKNGMHFLADAILDQYLFEFEKKEYFIKEYEKNIHAIELKTDFEKLIYLISKQEKIEIEKNGDMQGENKITIISSEELGNDPKLNNLELCINYFSVDYLISDVIWSQMRKCAREYLSNKWKERYPEYVLPDISNFDNLMENIADLIKKIIQNDKNGEFTVNEMHFCNYIIENVPELNEYTDIALSKKIRPMIYQISNQHKEELDMKSFEAQLIRRKTIEDIRKEVTNFDNMKGFEFECFIATLFEKMGYLTKITKGSGDQGIDIIAEKDDIRIGIQTKCYSSSVGNSAIQEVISGVNFYNLDKGFVITNNYFTSSAKELAKSSRVTLWDRDILVEKIGQYMK